MLKQRIITALVLLPIALGGFFLLDGLAFALFIGLVVTLGAWEWARLAGYNEQPARVGYAGVVALDADGQHLPESLPGLFVAQARSGASVVIGTCLGRLSRAKRLAWWYLRFLTGLKLQDLTSGLRLYDRRAMDILAGPEASLLDYQDIGVLMLLARNGLPVEETPVAMRERRDGHSRVFASWLIVARYMMHTTILCIAQLDAGRRAPRFSAKDSTAC